jgi:hypothetical protein
MNVLEASNNLFEWFSENDSVNIERDFSKILPEEKKSEENVACLSAALQDFEASELIKCNNDYWILKKPFSSFEQSVKINPSLALSIAHLVNGFCKVVGNDLDYCDASDITEKDVNNVIIIATHLLDSETKSILDS